MSLVTNHNLMAANVARTLNSHYSRLSASTQRLSSGLRINNSADDAAGLAIRELMRSDISALNQGVRNANDAISLIQTADGALGIIDEKLIRMKELAEQAATGTYNSTQRLMIDSEYQAMASEITRIANATDFNGVKLLDGSLAGEHDGSGLVSTGSLKIHFGTANDSAEDYYYLSIGNCTAAALGVGNGAVRPKTETVYLSPTGEELTPTTDFVTLDGQLHTPVYRPEWIQPVYTDGTSGSWIDPDRLFTFVEFIVVDGTPSGQYMDTEGGGMYVPQGPLQPYLVDYNGKKMEAYADTAGAFPLAFLVKDTVFEDANGNKYTADQITKKEVVVDGLEYADAYTVSTQEAAQRALAGINTAIESKDKIRAHLGAMQNRLENTITNLSTQAENLQAAESRISDVNVATEMTQFVRNQILTQSAVAMLAQANSLPQMAMQLIGA